MTSVAKFPRFAAGLVCLAIVSGCQRGPHCVPVTGKVTYQGAPVADAEVVFQPKEGRPALGKSDEQGVFVLSTYGDKDGALLGDYQVTIVKNKSIPGPAGDPYPRVQNQLPPRYAAPQTTPLTATVTDDVKPFDFALEDR